MLAIRMQSKVTNHEMLSFVMTAAGCVRTILTGPLSASAPAPAAGSGAPCPQCNASNDDTEPRPPKGFKTEFDKKGWRH
jgi:hypothetical protein